MNLSLIINTFIPYKLVQKKIQFSKVIQDDIETMNHFLIKKIEYLVDKEDLRSDGLT